MAASLKDAVRTIRCAKLRAGIFAGAYLCWQLDKRRVVVGLWGHGLWHVGTAIAAVVLFQAQLLGPHE